MSRADWENNIVRTAGRIIAGLFVGGTMLLGVQGVASAQTGSQSQSQQSQATTTTTTAKTTATTATTVKVAGSTLPKTGSDLGIPVAIGGGTLMLTVALRRLLAAR